MPQTRSTGVTLLLDRITQLCLVLAGINLLLLFISYVYEVVMRHVFNMPSTWSFDLGKAFLCVSVILALPDITRNRAHITIDLLLEKLRPDIRGRVKQLIGLTCFAVCMGTAWICVDETLRQFIGGIGTFWNHPIPKWWISVTLPVGFAISGLQFGRLALTKPDANN